MKKIMCLFLVIAVALSCTINATARVSSGDYVFDYYLNQFQDNKWKTPPSEMIGDGTLNHTINAADALLVLSFSVYGAPVYQPFYAMNLEALCRRFYEMGFHKEGRLENADFENAFMMGGSVLWHSIFQCYVNHSYFLSDVSNDCTVNAEDALLILQYAVGKIDQFPRTDYAGEGRFQYMVWPTEWYPTMYYDFRSNGNENAYDSVADIFPDIPPVQTE